MRYRICYRFRLSGKLNWPCWQIEAKRGSYNYSKILSNINMSKDSEKW